MAILDKRRNSAIMEDYPVHFNAELADISELHKLYSNSLGPDGRPAPREDHGQTAAEETAKLGEEPPLSQVANLMLTSLGECKEDMKKVTYIK